MSHEDIIPRTTLRDEGTEKHHAQVSLLPIRQMAREITIVLA